MKLNIKPQQVSGYYFSPKQQGRKEKIECKHRRYCLTQL